MSRQILQEIALSLRSRNTTLSGLLCGGALVVHAWVQPVFESPEQALGFAGLGLLMTGCMARDGHQPPLPTPTQKKDPAR